MLGTVTKEAGEMTDEHGDERQAPEDRTRSEASAHPEEAVDAAEERIFGRRMNQERDDESSAADDEDDSPSEPSG
jgi:hypothetical protein